MKEREHRLLMDAGRNGFADRGRHSRYSRSSENVADPEFCRPGAVYDISRRSQTNHGGDTQASKWPYPRRGKPRFPPEHGRGQHGRGSSHAAAGVELGVPPRTLLPLPPAPSTVAFIESRGMLPFPPGTPSPPTRGSTYVECNRTPSATLSAASSLQSLQPFEIREPLRIPVRAGAQRPAGLPPVHGGFEMPLRVPVQSNSLPSPQFPSAGESSEPLRIPSRTANAAGQPAPGSGPSCGEFNESMRVPLQTSPLPPLPPPPASSSRFSKHSRIATHPSSQLPRSAVPSYGELAGSVAVPVVANTPMPSRPPFPGDCEEQLRIPIQTGMHGPPRPFDMHPPPEANLAQRPLRPAAITQPPPRQGIAWRPSVSPIAQQPPRPIVQPPPTSELKQAAPRLDIAQGPSTPAQQPRHVPSPRQPPSDPPPCLESPTNFSLRAEPISVATETNCHLPDPRCPPGLLRSRAEISLPVPKFATARKAVSSAARVKAWLKLCDSEAPRSDVEHPPAAAAGLAEMCAGRALSPLRHILDVFWSGGGEEAEQRNGNECAATRPSVDSLNLSSDEELFRPATPTPSPSSQGRSGFSDGHDEASSPMEATSPAEIRLPVDGNPLIKKTSPVAEGLSPRSGSPIGNSVVDGAHVPQDSMKLQQAPRPLATSNGKVSASRSPKQNGDVRGTCAKQGTGRSISTGNAVNEHGSLGVHSSSTSGSVSDAALATCKTGVHEQWPCEVAGAVQELHPTFQACTLDVTHSSPRHCDVSSRDATQADGNSPTVGTYAHGIRAATAMLPACNPGPSGEVLNAPSEGGSAPGCEPPTRSTDREHIHSSKDKVVQCGSDDRTDRNVFESRLPVETRLKTPQGPRLGASHATISCATARAAHSAESCMHSECRSLGRAETADANGGTAKARSATAGHGAESSAPTVTSAGQADADEIVLVDCQRAVGHANASAGMSTCPAAVVDSTAALPTLPCTPATEAGGGVPRKRPLPGPAKPAPADSPAPGASSPVRTALTAIESASPISYASLTSQALDALNREGFSCKFCNRHINKKTNLYKHFFKHQTQKKFGRWLLDRYNIRTVYAFERGHTTKSPSSSAHLLTYPDWFRQEQLLRTLPQLRLSLQCGACKQTFDSDSDLYTHFKREMLSANHITFAQGRIADVHGELAGWNRHESEDYRPQWIRSEMTALLKAFHSTSPHISERPMEAPSQQPGTYVVAWHAGGLISLHGEQHPPGDERLTESEPPTAPTPATSEDRGMRQQRPVHAGEPSPPTAGGGGDKRPSTSLAAKAVAALSADSALGVGSGLVADQHDTPGSAGAVTSPNSPAVDLQIDSAAAVKKTGYATSTSTEDPATTAPAAAATGSQPQRCCSPNVPSHTTASTTEPIASPVNTYHNPGREGTSLTKPGSESVAAGVKRELASDQSISADVPTTAVAERAVRPAIADPRLRRRTMERIRIGKPSHAAVIAVESNRELDVGKPCPIVEEPLTPPAHANSELRSCAADRAWLGKPPSSAAAGLHGERGTGDGRPAAVPSAAATDLDVLSLNANGQVHTARSPAAEHSPRSKPSSPAAQGSHCEHRSIGNGTSASRLGIAQPGASPPVNTVLDLRRPAAACISLANRGSSAPVASESHHELCSDQGGLTGTSSPAATDAGTVENGTPPANAGLVPHSPTAVTGSACLNTPGSRSSHRLDLSDAASCSDDSSPLLTPAGRVNNDMLPDTPGKYIDPPLPPLPPPPHDAISMPAMTQAVAVDGDGVGAADTPPSPSPPPPPAFLCVKPLCPVCLRVYATAGKFYRHLCAGVLRQDGHERWLREHFGVDSCDEHISMSACKSVQSWTDLPDFVLAFMRQQASLQAPCEIRSDTGHGDTSTAGTASSQKTPGSEHHARSRRSPSRGCRSPMQTLPRTQEKDTCAGNGGDPKQEGSPNRRLRPSTCPVVPPPVLEVASCPTRDCGNTPSSPDSPSMPPLMKAPVRPPLTLRRQDERTTVSASYPPTLTCRDANPRRNGTLPPLGDTPACRDSGLAIYPGSSNGACVAHGSITEASHRLATSPPARVEKRRRASLDNEATMKRCRVEQHSAGSSCSAEADFLKLATAAESSLAEFFSVVKVTDNPSSGSEWHGGYFHDMKKCVDLEGLSKVVVIDLGECQHDSARMSHAFPRSVLVWLSHKPGAPFQVPGSSRSALHQHAERRRLAVEDSPNVYLSIFNLHQVVPVTIPFTILSDVDTISPLINSGCLTPRTVTLLPGKSNEGIGLRTFDL